MNSSEILVSVVIPTYSRNDVLERAIDGILRQTHQNLDVIVVDDNAPKSEWRASTELLMQKYRNDTRVRYIQNAEKLGREEARNEGIKVAKGDYIAFLDDDDEYYPEKIEKQLEVFLHSESEKLALVYCDVEHTSQSGHVDCVVRKHYRGNCLYEAIVNDCIASTSMWLVRKSCVEAVGNFSIVPCKQDSTVIIKLLAAGYEVDYVPEVLVKYYNFKGVPRISFGPKKIQGEQLFYELCQKQYSFFDKKQIKNIEYSFAERFYTLYTYRKDEDAVEKMKQYANRMWKCNPYKSAVYFLKRYYHQLKRK